MIYLVTVQALADVDVVYRIEAENSKEAETLVYDGQGDKVKEEIISLHGFEVDQVEIDNTGEISNEVHPAS